MASAVTTELATPPYFKNILHVCAKCFSHNTQKPFGTF